MGNGVRISSGFNTVPVPIGQLVVGHLTDYLQDEMVKTEWHDYLSRQLAGDRTWVTIGKPYVKWAFFRLLRVDYPILAAYAGPVSIYTLNQTTNAYHTYNGMAMPLQTNVDAVWEGGVIGGFPDAVMTIYDLVQVS